MKKVLTLLIAIYSITGFAQTITVIDEEKGFPVKGAAIYNKNLTVSIITDDKGKADISIFSVNDIITISHISYINFRTNKAALKRNKNKILLIKKTGRLDEVVLSVFKKKEKITRIAEETYALTKEDIFKESPQTSADLLASVPGIKVQKSQFGGGSPVLRGMESNRVLLVVDGVRMNNAIYRKGHLQNSITISPSILDRTEVVFGPSSVIYGSDALGGVIHFYTRTPKISEEEEIKSEFFSRFGTVNQEVTTNVSAELSFKKWASFTSVSYSSFGDLRMGTKRSHGFNDWGLVTNYSENIGNNYAETPIVNSNSSIQRNTGYNQTDILQKFYVPLSKTTATTFNIQYSTSSNIPRFDRLTELKSGSLKFAEWYYGPQERLLISSQLAINPQKKWLDEATITVAYQNIKESRNQRKFGSLEKLFRKEQVDVYSINGDFTTSLTKDKKRNLSYGFEFTHNDVTSAAEGKILEISNNKVVGYSGDFKVQTRFPDGGSSYSSAAGYIDYRQDLNSKSTLNTGLRLTNVSLKANWIDATSIALPSSKINLETFNGSATIGYIYKPTKNWKLNTLVSTGFRSPNIDDVGKIREKNGAVLLPNILLFSDEEVQNVQLTSEYAYNTEIGIQKFFNNRTFSLGLNMYYTYLLHNIVRRPTNDQILYDGELLPIESNINNAGGYVKGFTTTYFGQLNQYWKTSGFVTYTKGKSQGYFDSSESENIIEPMSSIPPLFGRFELSYRKNKIEISADFRFNAKKDITTYNITEGIDNHVQTPIINDEATDPLEKYYGTPSWSTFGLRGGYFVNENITVQGSLSNIFDKHYKEFASGISAPGRNLSVSIHAIF